MGSGCSRHAARPQAPLPKPRWMPLPQLLYAQVVKTVRRRRLVAVQSPRGVRHAGGRRAGAGAAVAGRSIPPSWSGSTSPSASMWPRSGDGSARCARAKTACGSSWPCTMSTTISVCPMRAYASPCPSPSPPTARGSRQAVAAWTPAMAAGLTDHVWTLREVLLFRVPPWPQPAGV